MSDAPLKLSAADAEDLQVIAAICQDALVPVGEMAYLQDEKRFVLALNRFRWDQAPEAEAGAAPADGKDASFWDKNDRGPVYERVLCGLTFENVTAVRSKQIDLRKRDEILALLTIHSEPGAVMLLFAGGGIIKLEIGELRCFLQDFGQSWPTRRRPRHPDESGHR
jgi:hypothetical protein